MVKKQKTETNKRDTTSRKKKYEKKIEVSDRDHSKLVASTFPLSSSQFSSNWKLFLESEKTKKDGLKIVGNAQKQNRHDGNKIKNYSKRKRVIKKHPPRVLKNGGDRDEKATVTNDNIWFDGVDPRLIEKECGLKILNTKLVNQADEKVAKESEMGNVISSNVTRYVALDCEMVGVGPGGKDNALARVSLVNSLGECIYDKFVKPIENVVDYRTDVSGVRPVDLKEAPSYETVQKEVFDLLKGRILVGHALHNDLKVLMLSHSRKQIRDTAKYKPFKKLLKTKRPALRKLAAQILNKQIQTGEHSSVIDAMVTMEIFQKYKKEWERSLRTKQDAGEAEKKTIFMGTSSDKTKKLNKWKKRRNKSRAQ